MATSGRRGRPKGSKNSPTASKAGEVQVQAQVKVQVQVRVRVG